MHGYASLYSTVLEVNFAGLSKTSFSAHDFLIHSFSLIEDALHTPQIPYYDSFGSLEFFLAQTTKRNQTTFLAYHGNLFTAGW